MESTPLKTVYHPTFPGITQEVTNADSWYEAGWLPEEPKEDQADAAEADPIQSTDQPHPTPEGE